MFSLGLVSYTIIYTKVFFFFVYLEGDTLYTPKLINTNHKLYTIPIIRDD